MKAPDTKTILNISLIIGIVLIGKKVLEKFGVLSSAEDKIAKDLDLGAGSDITDTTNSASPGLALAPNYWISIFSNINKTLKAQKKNLLTGKQIKAFLTFEPERPITKFDFATITKGDGILKGIFNTNKLIVLQKKAGVKEGFENSYLNLAYLIYNAKGILKDNPEIVNSAFQKLNSRAKVSYLSSIFSRAYNTDLQTYLASFLNENEISKIANYLKNKKLV